MTDTKKPEELADQSLDDAQGGILDPLLVAASKAEKTTSEIRGMPSIDFSIDDIPQSTREPSSGLATGKRMHSPVTISSGGMKPSGDK
ncbi:MAG: hypothetical protein AAF479_14440 [Pseudomonadota bacterium]